MYKHEITFSLNSEERLIILGQHPDDSCCCCCEATVRFSTKDKNYNLGDICFGIGMSAFGDKLNNAIDGKLLRYKQISHSIGYEWNLVEYYFCNGLGKVPELIYEKNSDGSYEKWIGHKFEILSTSVFDHLGTWLYNDKHGSIVLEIGPIYPWHSYDPETEPFPENFVPFEEYMKSYNPILIRKIPAEIARIWSQQALHGAENLKPF